MPRSIPLASTVGLCVALVACESRPGGGPTEPDITVQAAPSAATAGSALTFTGTWRTMPPLQPARWRHAADMLGRSIVVVGGLSGDQFHALSRVDAFDVATRTWTALADLPLRLYDANGATAIDGKLYVTGGRSGPDDSPLKSLYVYDPTMNSWTRKADMPLRGSVGVQANIHGQLYVYTFPQSSQDRQLFASYNPKTDRWVRRPLPMDTHFANPVAGAIDGKFYLTSGQGTTEAFSRELEVYDPATGTWTIKSPMPTARAVAAAAVLHGKLFVAGGVVVRNGLAVVTDIVEAYDPVTNRWATGPSMPTARGHAVSAWAGGKFFVIDGIAGGPLSNRVEALSTTY